MAKGVLFDKGSARRIAEAVRTVESMGIDETSDIGKDRGQTWVIFAKITAILNDYLICVRHYEDLGIDGTSTIYVARPRLLRRAGLHLATITYPNGQSILYTYLNERQRTATATGDSEGQMLTPNYFIGEIIRAIRGKTSVIDPDGNNCTWEDLNTAGRHWAKTSS